MKFNKDRARGQQMTADHAKRGVKEAEILKEDKAANQPHKSVEDKKRDWLIIRMSNQSKIGDCEINL